jgi:hypothetical protein
VGAIGRERGKLREGERGGIVCECKCNYMYFFCGLSVSVSTFACVRASVNVFACLVEDKMKERSSMLSFMFASLGLHSAFRSQHEYLCSIVLTCCGGLESHCYALREQGCR